MQEHKLDTLEKRSPWTSGSCTRPGGRQEAGTFGIKSSVRQRSTEEFANKEGE